jgi:hypothetical protein
MKRRFVSFFTEFERHGGKIALTLFLFFVPCFAAFVPCFAALFFFFLIVLVAWMCPASEKHVSRYRSGDVSFLAFIEIRGCLLSSRLGIAFLRFSVLSLSLFLEIIWSDLCGDLGGLQYRSFLDT